jgi:hypothetical protein
MPPVQREEFTHHIGILREDSRQDKQEVLEAIREVRDVVRQQNSRVGKLEIQVAAIEAEPNLRRDRFARTGTWVSIVGLILTWVAVLRGWIR